MTIRAVQITTVPVSDQERARSFYVDVLGLEPLVDHLDPGGRRWLQVAPHGSQSTLALLTDGSMAPGSVRGLVLETDDIDGDVARLRKRGIEVPDGIQDMPWARAAAFSDPDGNQLVLQTPLRAAG